MRPKRITTFAILAAILAAVAALSTPVPPDRQFFNLPDVPRPNGYTHVVTAAPGRMVFVSGQGGRGADGKMPADFTTQAENTFRNLGRCLERGGATFKDVVKINYFLTDLANTTELRRVRAGYLNMEAPPAATLVQSGLAGGLLLEVELVAIVPERR